MSTLLLTISPKPCQLTYAGYTHQQKPQMNVNWIAKAWNQNWTLLHAII